MTHTTDRPRSRWTLAALALGVLILCTAADSQDLENTRSKRGHSSVASAVYTGGGDETLGTLPSLAGPSTNRLQLTRYRPFRGPRAFVEGPATSLLCAIEGARGDRRAAVQQLPGGRVRLYFPSDVQVAFDRQALQSSGWRFGVELLGQQPMLGATASWGGRALVGWSPALDLPVSQLEASGLLDSAPLSAVVVSESGKSRVAIRAVGGLVILTQVR